jgi:hypothetical protein
MVNVTGAGASVAAGAEVAAGTAGTAGAAGAAGTTGAAGAWVAVTGAPQADRANAVIINILNNVSNFLFISLILLFESNS